MPDSLTALSHVTVSPDYHTLCERVADRIVELVLSKPDAVLGLATGATPKGVYQALIRRHQEQRLDFSRVTCFNLDEYYPMSPDSPHSYHSFMRENLFSSLEVRQWSVPGGEPRGPEQIERDCLAYEAAIREAGGIDLQLLGIGRTGHIGFNEPGSPRGSRTRLVTLDPVTRHDAAPDFGGMENVPTQAVTVGLATIFEARAIVLMASGKSKADIVRRALTGVVTEDVPASLLQNIDRVRYFLDSDAAERL